DRGLDLFYAADQVFDHAARLRIQQGDTRAGAGSVAGRADLREIAVRDHSEHHRVFHVDMTAEGAGESNPIYVIGAKVIHQQPYSGVERSLGELNRADVVLRDHQRVRARVKNIRVGAAVLDDAPGAGGELAIDHAITVDDTRKEQLSNRFDDARAAH